jgi:hypothetical protein
MASPPLNIRCVLIIIGNQESCDVIGDELPIYYKVKIGPWARGFKLVDIYNI